MEKMMNTKTEGNTFTKKIGQTVYVVRYHFNEDAKETMQEKINRMLVTEASRQAIQDKKKTYCYLQNNLQMTVGFFYYDSEPMKEQKR